MQKFGFRIQTRAGLTVDNLVIQGADQAQAEIKLRQMYHHCTILECRTLEDTLRNDATDVEGAISLIVSKDSDR
ncbi:MAG: hypothetical protein JNK75_02845 [Betaproteobacteria bacterium]|nr:hypothetical protein [Betaproteobacteria bacterium]